MNGSVRVCISLPNLRIKDSFQFLKAINLHSVKRIYKNEEENPP